MEKVNSNGLMDAITLENLTKAQCMEKVSSNGLIRMVKRQCTKEAFWVISSMEKEFLFGAMVIFTAEVFIMESITEKESFDGLTVSSSIKGILNKGLFHGIGK